MLLVATSALAQDGEGEEVFAGKVCSTSADCGALRCVAGICRDLSAVPPPPPLDEGSPEGKRLMDILHEASGGRSAQLAIAWTAFGVGLVEAAVGGATVVLVATDTERIATVSSLIVPGTLLALAFSPALSYEADIGALEGRASAELTNPIYGTPDERVRRVAALLRARADAERGAWIGSLALESVLLATCAAAVVLDATLSGLTNDERLGFGLAASGTFVAGVALLIDTIFTRPSQRAEGEWERPRPKTTFRVRPLVGPTSVGFAGVF